MIEMYGEYLDEWLNGLSDEIDFWKNYMETKGDIYEDSFEETVSEGKTFTLEDDLPDSNITNPYKFIDVGSGPFSRCGNKTNKIDLSFTAIDPLAEVYSALKHDNDLENGIEVETGFVELLDKKFMQNTFDMVHMSNSLDHCFDAVFGVFQLLYICKIGGKVILRHAENEAERSGYSGLHQWNLSTQNIEQSFVIWRKNKRYDICKIFKDYADVKVYSNIWEKDWEYNKVIMTKKRDIVLPQNCYYEEMLSHIYSFLLKNLIREVNGKPSKKQIIEENRKMLQKIQNLKGLPEYLNLKMKELSMKNISLYGLGVVGKALLDILEKEGIRPEIIIDRQIKKYKNIESVDINSADLHCESNIVIITVLYDTEKIKILLREHGYSDAQIITIADIVQTQA